MIAPAVREPGTMGAVLRRPGFSLLVVGQTISQLGDKLHHMALIALVGAGARVETGGIELAKLSVVFTAPVVLFGPLAGALVDRRSKRGIMIACDLLRAILVALIPTIYQTTGHLWSVYVVAFFVFLLGMFFNAAKMAVIPDLVHRDELLAANAALTSIGRVATVLGIVGGGALIGLPIWQRIGWSSYAAGFYLDAISFALSVITLTGIAALAGAAFPHPPVPHPEAHGPRTLLTDVRISLGVIRKTPGLRFAFTSLVMLALFASTVYVAMTVSVQTVLGRGTTGVGILGGFLGAGMVLGSLAVGALGKGLSREAIIRTGIGVIGVLMALGGIVFTFDALIPVAFLGGLVLAPVMVAQDTLVHEHAPAGNRAVLFASKDLLLAGVFAATAFTVGGTIYLLGNFGVGEPYRWVLGLVGAVLLVALPLLRTRPVGPNP